jgi:acyl-CoA dehydrogenase
MASIDDFRREVRSWLGENLPAELRVGTRRDLPSKLMKKWILALGARGWITPEWPTEYGGGGLDRQHAAALRAELKTLRAPIVSSFGTSMLGPTLLEFGT